MPSSYARPEMRSCVSEACVAVGLVFRHDGTQMRRAWSVSFEIRGDATPNIPMKLIGTGLQGSFVARQASANSLSERWVDSHVPTSWTSPIFTARPLSSSTRRASTP